MRCTLVTLLLLLTMLSQAAQFAPAAAQAPANLNVRQEDLDDDGRPDLAVIFASFATDRDVVQVYDGAGDMSWGDTWQDATDFENDTWVFDVLADGSAQLVIRFSREGNDRIASLFEDHDGDATVASKIDGSEVTIQESQYPSLTAIARGGWFLPDGRLNWNVRFLTDGPVLHLHTYRLTNVWQGILSYDGEPDVELEFRDGDLDGIPEYGLWRVIAPTPSSWGATRTWVWANIGRSRPNQPSGFLFWPYLTTLASTDPTSTGSDSVLFGATIPQTLRYFDAPPVVAVNLREGKISQVAFSGYPIEAGFHVNTEQHFLKGETNYADFEVAQAYYDLAQDRDGDPELHIRHRYFGERDLFGWNLGVPVNEIRWSWNQANDSGLAWDFKVGLAGRQVLTQAVEFPDFSYYAVPYERLPYWVTDSSWDYATFVAKEDTRRFLSSEGVYTWGAVETVADDEPSSLSRYLAGQVDVDLAEAFNEVAPGWRGELAPRLQGSPILYFSAVDHRLHLRGAAQGVWNLDDRADVRYTDLNGDGYLDQWLLSEDDDLSRQLIAAGDYLIYADRQRVLLKPLGSAVVLFETLPPRDHEEWQALSQQLEAKQRHFAAGDFEAMVAQFEGPEWRVDAAEIRGFRPEGDAFRFVLRLKPGFSVTGSDGPDLDGLYPGEYVISHTDQFEVLPLTPARIEVVPGTFHLSDASPVAHESLWIEAKVRNVGLQDAPDVWIHAYAEGPDGYRDFVTEEKIELLAGRSQALRLDWAPPGPGPWRIHLQWGLGSHDEHSLDAGGSGATLDVQVERPQPLNTVKVWQISNQREPLLLLGFLFAVALAAASALVVSLRAVGGR